MRPFASARSVVACCVLLAAASPRPAVEDGYELWLRYRLVGDSGRLAEYRAALTHLVVEGDSPTLRAARDELSVGLAGLLGGAVPGADSVLRDGALIAGTPATSRLVAGLPLADDLRRAGDEGFVLRALRVRGRQTIVVAGNSGVGVLYGAFNLPPLIQTGAAPRGPAQAHAPEPRLRELGPQLHPDGTPLGEDWARLHT